MAFDENFMYELRMRTNSEELVGNYINLKRTGKNLKGLCPFHSEKTPSFTVYPDSWSFFCFGCGAGGDMISFAKRIENLDYFEAVKFLAKRAGLEIPDENPADSGISAIKNRIREANREAARFFHSRLIDKSGKDALNYLTTRGMRPEMIRRFGVGFAPDSWNELSKYLLSRGFTKEEIITADLAHENKFGNLNDRFRNRIMFPIIDLQGNVIAFGGRDLTGQSKAKYINTSDTLIYKKTNNLFALNFAKNSEGNELVLCEGYMDVISVHSAGFTNAVATCGTALTAEQAVLLSRYAGKLVLAYDADEAGRKAIARAIPIIRKTGMEIKVLVVKGAKDPDEYIKKNGSESFRALLEKAPSDVEYLLENAERDFDLGTPHGKVAYLNKCVEILSAIDNKIEQSVYIGKLAEKLSVESDAIKAQLYTRERRSFREEKKKEQQNMMRETSGKNDKVNTERSGNVRAASAEDTIIRFLFSNTDYISKLAEKLKPDEFVTSFNKKLYSTIVEREIYGNITISSFSDVLSDTEMSALARILHSGREIRYTEAEIDQCIEILKEEKGKITVEDAGKSDAEDLKNYLAELAKKKKK